MFHLTSERFFLNLIDFLIRLILARYISGTPTLGPFPYSALRSAPPGTTRLLALSYRLAKHPSHAFPGAIQDALAAWIYLTQHLGFRPENIILVSVGSRLSLLKQDS